MTVEEIKGPEEYVSSLRTHLVMDALVTVLGPEQWKDRKFGLLEDALAILVHLRDEAHHVLIDVWDEHHKEREQHKQLVLDRQAKHRELIAAVDKILSAHKKSLFPRESGGMIGVEMGEHYCTGCAVSIDNVTFAPPHPCYINRILSEAIDARSR